MSLNKYKKVIGWREYVDLPDWGILRLKAKIDTGARTSSLHVEDVKELPGNKISFYVVLGKNKKRKKIIATPVRQGKVKSSIGIRTHRWYVMTKLRLGSIERKIKINLIGRDEMNFRMLIGRTAIEDDFLVDAAHGYILGNGKIVTEKLDENKSVNRRKKKVHQ